MKFDNNAFLGSELQDRQPLGTGSRRGSEASKTPLMRWPKNPRPQHKATSFHHKDDLSASISHKMKTWNLNLYLTKKLRPRQLGSCHQYMDTGQDRRTQASGFWNVPRYKSPVAPVPSHAVMNGFSVAFLRLWNLERHGNEANPILALLLADSHRLMAEEALQLKQVEQVVVLYQSGKVPCASSIKEIWIFGSTWYDIWHQSPVKSNIRFVGLCFHSNY